MLSLLCAPWPLPVPPPVATGALSLLPHTKELVKVNYAITPTYNSFTADKRVYLVECYEAREVRNEQYEQPDYLGDHRCLRGLPGVTSLAGHSPDILSSG